MVNKLFVWGSLNKYSDNVILWDGRLFEV